MKKIISMLCLLLTSVSYAGEILLDNGDTIEGELFSISSDRVVWKSTSLGRLNIPKNRIVDIVSFVPLKIRSRNGACHWAGLNKRKALLECEEGGVVEMGFLSIKEAVLYSGYKKATYEYRGKLSATGQRESGLRDKQDWRLDTNIFMRHTDFRHDIWWKYRAESRNKNPLQQRYELTYQFDWFFAPKTFWSTQLSGLRDEIRLIDRRYGVSTGIGYQFWENRRSALSLETGPQYLDEVLIESTNNPDDKAREFYASWRMASSFKILLPRDTRFFAKVEILRSLKDGDDWEADTNMGLSLPIAGGITAELTYDYDYDNTPVDDRSARDSRFRVGLGYQW